MFTKKFVVIPSPLLTVPEPINHADAFSRVQSILRGGNATILRPLKQIYAAQAMRPVNVRLLGRMAPEALLHNAVDDVLNSITLFNESRRCAACVSNSGMVWMMADSGMDAEDMLEHVNLYLPFRIEGRLKMTVMQMMGSLGVRIDTNGYARRNMDSKVDAGLLQVPLKAGQVLFVMPDGSIETSFGAATADAEAQVRELLPRLIAFRLPVKHNVK
jgi:hypothetical protein